MKKGYEIVISYTANLAIPPLEKVTNISQWIHQSIEREIPLTDQEWKNLVFSAGVISTLSPDEGPFMMEEMENPGSLNWLQRLMKWCYFEHCIITRKKQLRFWERPAMVEAIVDFNEEGAT